MNIVELHVLLILLLKIQGRILFIDILTCVGVGWECTS